MTICKHCGNPFTPKGYAHRGPQQFCCIPCYRAWMKTQGRTCRCRSCLRLFVVKGRDRTYCSRLCYRTATKTTQALRLQAAQDARRKLANDRVRAMLTLHFGVITTRELHVFKWAWKEAYRRGYNRAYKRSTGAQV